MSDRVRLPNRRFAETFNLDCRGMTYIATISRFDDGRVAEIFLSNHKAGSQADTNAKDAAVVCSLALQYGAPLDVIRRALLRDPQGRASSPLGVALDAIAGGQQP
jgi:ribonucleoside-diphosphate reductase alpha chain